MKWLRALSMLTLFLALVLASIGCSKKDTTLPPTMAVHLIDVGQGDAILIDCGTTEVLIDGGSSSPAVVSYLNDYVDEPLEVVVATHPHADHIGGLTAVLESFQVQEVWRNGEESTSQTYAAFDNAMNRRVGTIRQVL